MACPPLPPADYASNQPTTHPTFDSNTYKAICRRSQLSVCKKGVYRADLSIADADTDWRRRGAEARNKHGQLNRSGKGTEGARGAKQQATIAFRFGSLPRVVRPFSAQPPSFVLDRCIHSSHDLIFVLGPQSASLCPYSVSCVCVRAYTYSELE